MLMTKQQIFLLDMLERLGCAREGQLTALLLPVFCREKPDKAAPIVSAAMRQISLHSGDIQETGGVYHLCGKGINWPLLEAVDVMLELTGGQPLDMRRGRLPVLLRFGVQGEKIRDFAVIPHGNSPPLELIRPRERIILLFDGQGPVRPLPVSNKQFLPERLGIRQL